jgi:hypothetical protein
VGANDMARIISGYNFDLGIAALIYLFAVITAT